MRRKVALQIIALYCILFNYVAFIFFRFNSFLTANQLGFRLSFVQDCIDCGIAFVLQGPAAKRQRTKAKALFI